MNFLEELIYEYYDWKGFLVKRNIKIGKLDRGGWKMELDIIAYHPKDKKLIHVECSTDAHTWKVREERFNKKFKYGREYIYAEIFPWVDKSTPIEQIAILPSRSKDREILAGAKLITIDEFGANLKQEIISEGKISQSAISEQYPLLRTVQLIENGYYKKIN